MCTSKHRSTDDDESDNQSSVKQRTSFLWLAIDDDNNDDDGLCNGNKTEQLFGQKIYLFAHRVLSSISVCSLARPGPLLSANISV